MGIVSTGIEVELVREKPTSNPNRKKTEGK